MNNNHYPLIYWGLYFSGAAYALLLVRLILQGSNLPSTNRMGGFMLAATALTILWSGLSVMALVSGRYFWWIFAQTADTLRYVCWGIFIFLFFKPQASTKYSTWWRWLPIFSLLAFIISLSLVIGIHALAGVTGDAFFMVLLALGGLVLVEQLFRNLPKESLWSAKPLCLGLAGIFIFDLYLFSEGMLFQAIDPDALTARPFVHALMVPLFILATARHRNWISKIHVSRVMVFHSATLLIAGSYLLFIAGVGYYVRYFGGEWGGALQLGIVFVALVLAIAFALSGSLRAKLRVFLGKNFFRYQFDYREEWLKFTATLSHQNHPQEYGENVIKGLADMLESPAGALWLLRPEDDQYRQVARWNMAPTSQTEGQHGKIATFMRSTGWVINIDECRNSPEIYQGLDLPEWIKEYPQAWLLVPLWQSENMLGFVMLASPRTLVNVNWEVTDLLKTAGRQAASFLAQRQATEALLEARKFEAFSRMSAFVVHDLKNIITQLSLMVKNAKRLQNNPEFQADMLMTVENSLDRMRQLMLQLRGDTVPGTSSIGVNLGKIAERLAKEALCRGRNMQLDIAPHVFTRGQAERMERIIGHLVHNAFDATDTDGKVWMKVDRLASHARIQVGDNGQGMTEEFMQTRLFKPFQSTKEAGMGIGTYESFQYVRELGGKVSVNSEVGKGTVVCLLLPLMEAFHDSNLQPQETA
ncbi:MAG: PEP-CTERM system histidine kinase PrsK [Simplicispira sp.]|nr:PEP-CTERM system histidine kinase PrsK [Simplicispira sp.]